MGTTRYFLKNTSIVPWNSISSARRQKIFSITYFKMLIEDVNLILDNLNTHRRLTEVHPRVDEYRAYLYRIGQYEEN